MDGGVTTYIPTSPRGAVIQMIGLQRRGYGEREASEKSTVFRDLDDTKKPIAWVIFMRSVEQRTVIRAIIDKYVTKPLVGRNAAVDDILVCGVSELMSGKKPYKLVVASCVGYCKDLGFESMSGLVNAVLRKISDELALQRAA